MLFDKKEEGSQLPDLPSPRRPFDINSQMSSEAGQSAAALPELPEAPKTVGPAVDENAKIVEMEEWQPTRSGIPQISSEEEHPELEEVSSDAEELLPPPPVSAPPRKVAVASKEPKADVFVRIDKFHSARKSLGEIRDRLEDIDDLVKRIRETKLREEQELSSWEKDITHIKSRVQTVSENIFEKVE